MTEEGNTGLTWERRLALWLPRPLLFGAFLIAACLSVAYLIFQWYFALPFDYKAILLTLYIAFVLMSVRWELLACNAADLYGFDLGYLAAHTEITALAS